MPMSRSANMTAYPMAHLNNVEHSGLSAVCLRPRSAGGAGLLQKQTHIAGGNEFVAYIDAIGKLDGNGCGDG